MRNPLLVTVGMVVVVTGSTCSKHRGSDAPAVAARSCIVEPLRERVIANLHEAELVFERFERLALSTDDPTGLLAHGLLGHGSDYTLRDGDDSVSCLDWLLRRASCRPLTHSLPLLRVTDDGPVFRETTGDAASFEAHFGQTLFCLSETGILPHATTVQVDAGGDPQPLSLLVGALRSNVHEYADLSFCLPVLLRWSDEARWQCRFGSRWTLSRMLEAHLTAEERSVVCGGGHWRYALAFAVKGDHRRCLDRRVLDLAKRRLGEILDATLAGIEPGGRIADGAIPVPDPMRFSHQVHTLEWLMVAVSDETLRSHAQFHEAVSWAMQEMMGRWDELSRRDLCHAVHALRGYVARVERMLPENPTIENSKSPGT